MGAMVAQRWIPRVCAAVFVCGIAGIIITSIAGNNNGAVLTIGGCVAAAALVLLTYSALVPHQRIDAFVEADAQQLEARIAQLVAAGADEDQLRELVRDAMRLERR
jgi:cell division protein FtsW (lipid II flippase)